MFGESRIDFDDYDDDELSSLDEPDDANRKSFSNTHQSVYIPDEDLPLRFNGLSVSTPKMALWSTGCAVSLGTLWLLGRWLPNIWLKSVGRRGEFADASYIVVEVSRAGTVTLKRPQIGQPY
jgi:cation-transporting ATPase 13A3/4/5